MLRRFGLMGLAAAGFFHAAAVWAVLPPHFYEAREEQSEIKAVALVKSVEVVSRQAARGTVENKVVFQLVHKLTDREVPETFTGHCQSVVDDSKVMVGGAIYYYPIAGVRAYVAVSKDGGAITAYHSVDAEREKRLVEDFEKGGLLLGQIRAKGMPKTSLLEIDDTYQFLVGGEPLGTLRVQHQPEFYRTFKYDFELVVDGEPVSLRIETGYDNDVDFRLVKHSVYDSGAEKHLADASFNEKHPDNKLPEGILRAPEGQRIITSLPEHTVTDLLMFEIIKKMPFQEDCVLKVNILEACEMNLKKGFTVKHAGLDDGLRRFDQTRDSGGVAARYWLDENRRLRRVAWDDDKEFVLIDGVSPVESEPENR